VDDSYPIHDKDHQLEFILGMWFHTRATHGVPTEREIRASLPKWPRSRFKELLAILARHGQVQA
jgi:hypothetical protein